MSKFITVSNESDAWGANTEGFDIEAEVEKITDAAEFAGIEVYDYHSKPRDRDEFDQIDWFSTWCCEGHAWSDEQWRDWFAEIADGN